MTKITQQLLCISLTTILLS